MVVLFIINVAAYFFLQSELEKVAKDVKDTNSIADSSSTKSAELKKLSEYLEKEKSAVSRVKNIVAESSSYQDKVINDITLYAQKSGVFVDGITFESNSQNTSVAPTANATIQQPGATSAGINYKTAIINIRNPVQYRNIMQFLYYIENNLTRMDVTEVSLTKVSDSSQEVSINPLNVKVYVK
jgi:lysozyme family protein